MNSQDKPDSKPPYEIGYGKPPKTTQFKKKGQSGNPSGRKKSARTRDLREIAERILGEQITDGRTGARMSNAGAILLALRSKGLQGNARAVRRLTKLAQRTGNFTRAEPKPFIKILQTSVEDEILDRFRSGNGSL